MTDRPTIRGLLRLLALLWLLASPALAFAQPAEPDTAPPADEPAGDEPTDDGEAPQPQPQPQPVTQVPISDIVVMCDVPYCDDLDNVATLEEVTGLWAGQQLDVSRVDRARERLVETGYFAKVEARVEPARDGGAVVIFDTIGQPFVHEVVFHETGSLFESELKKWLFLRSGRPLAPRPVTVGRLTDGERAALTLPDLARLALDDQREALERLYEKEGYYDARVELWTEVAGSHRVDLHVDVAPGPTYGLGRVYIRGHEHFDYDTIERDLRDAFGFFAGFSRAQLDEGIEELVEAYRDDGYIQVRVSHRIHRVPEREAFDVFVDIDEGRRWAFAFEGNKTLDVEELAESLTFVDSGFVDDAEIASSIDELEARYETAGHYWANITVQRPFERTDDLTTVTFLIDEGPRSEISDIVFEGNTVLTDEALLDSIQSQPYQAFGGGAYPQRTLIANDANLIVDAYQALGYLTADVPGWRLEPSLDNIERLVLTFEIVEGPKTVVRSVGVSASDQALVEDAAEELGVATAVGFNVANVATDILSLRRPLVSEGYARAEVSAVCEFSRRGKPVNVQLSPLVDPELTERVEELFEDDDDAGDTSLPGDERPESLDEDAAAAGALDSTIAACAPPRLPPGCLPANPEDLCKTRGDATTGFTETCARTRPTANDVAGGASCSLASRASDSVDVRYSVRAGKPHYVGDFFIHGNYVTAGWVVRQDFPFSPGDPLDLDGLLRARGKLRSRAIYDSVIVNTIGLEDASQDAALSRVPIVIYVEEGTRRWLDLTVGLTLIATEFFGELQIEFVEANLFGTGTSLSLAFLPVFRFLNQAGELVLTRNFNQDWFTLLTLRVPIAPVSGINLLVQLFYDLRYIPDPQLEEQGGIVEVRWDLTRELFMSTAFEAKLSATRELRDATDDQEFDLCLPVVWFQDCGFGPRLQTYSIVLPRIYYNARDSLLNPTDGYVLDGRLKFAFTEDVGFFIKPDIRGTFYETFLRNFTFALNGRVGAAILVDTSDPLPPFERFFLGGINMRGFELNAVGPRRVDEDNPAVPTDEPFGGEFLLNMNAELRIPILRDLGLYSVIFVDVGSLLADQFLDYDNAGDFFGDLFLEELRVTTGLGLRFLLAETLPPIVLDYGIIVNRRPGEPFGGAHFNVGYTF